jgi:hypothetical protein
MSLQLLKADTSDALTLNGISKRAFDSDVFVGGASAEGPPGYMSVSFHIITTTNIKDSSWKEH